MRVSRASNNSIRLRILKLRRNDGCRGVFDGFKQFDPVADTETKKDHLGDGHTGGFKQFDPVADTETYLIIVLQLIISSFKQFDPVADTETCWRGG